MRADPRLMILGQPSLCKQDAAGGLCSACIVWIKLTASTASSSSSRPGPDGRCPCVHKFDMMQRVPKSVCKQATEACHRRLEAAGNWKFRGSCVRLYPANLRAKETSCSTLIDNLVITATALYITHRRAHMPAAEGLQPLTSFSCIVHSLQ